MLALVSSFISLYCTSNKDILINFYKANSLETVKFDMNSNNNLNDFINGNKYLMYKSFTTILDKNEINVYISDEDFNGVKISSALNDFYHNSYKINDMIEISYQNRPYEFKISEIIAEEYNNEIDFIVDSNYIIVSEKVLDVEPIFVVVRGDAKEILTLAYQCQLNVQINQSTINLEVGPYKTDLYKAFIIVGSIFGLGFSMLFFLNFIINQRTNISFLYLTNFKKKTIYKIYSFILLIYSLLIVVFGVSFSYIVFTIFNYYIMNRENYNFLPYSFNNISFVSLIILLVIYGFVYYLKLYNYLKKSKIDFIKDNI